jgi:hypothetical protein
VIEWLAARAQSTVARIVDTGTGTFAPPRPQDLVTKSERNTPAPSMEAWYASSIA